MLLNTALLFELPVYRIDRETYYREFQEYVEDYKTEYLPKENPIHLENFRGQWEYNEIIGYLKFYISGKTQIRVEYHETKTQIKVKTRKKVFIKRKGSFCTRSISSTLANKQIVKLLEECIEHCKKNLPSNRYIKTDFFDATYKHTDWKNIIA